mgnify:CR=1 FL=1
MVIEFFKPDGTRLNVTSAGFELDHLGKKETAIVTAATTTTPVGSALDIQGTTSGNNTNSGSGSVETPVGVDPSGSATFNTVQFAAKDGTEYRVTDAMTLTYTETKVEPPVIKPVYADAQSKPEVAINEAVRLIEQEKVDMLLGFFSSAQCVPVAGRVEQLGKFMWITTCISTAVLENQHRDRLATDGIAHAMAQLDDRSRRIVAERWLKVNDDGSGGMTLHELAAEYGVSAERIRQIEVAAMKKMRKALEAYA